MNKLEGFVESNCFNVNFGTKLYLPWVQGVNNFKKAFTPYKEVNGTFIPISSGKRVAHFVVGIILFIPIINFLALYILKTIQVRIEAKRSASATRQAKALVKLRGTVLVIAFVQKRKNIANRNKEAHSKEHSMFAHFVNRIHRIGSHLKKSVGIIGLLVMKQRKMQAVDAVVGAVGLGVHSVQNRKWKRVGYAACAAVISAFNGFFQVLLPRNVRDSVRIDPLRA